MSTPNPYPAEPSNLLSILMFPSWEVTAPPKWVIAPQVGDYIIASEARTIRLILKDNP